MSLRVAPFLIRVDASALEEVGANATPADDTFGKTTSPAIVKKIVEADDEEPAARVKRSALHSKAVHKKPVFNDSEIDRDPAGSNTTEVSENVLDDSRSAAGSHKPSSDRRPADMGVREATPTAAGTAR